MRFIPRDHYTQLWKWAESQRLIKPLHHTSGNPAIDLNKPRWLLAHDNVVFTRTLLNNLGYKGKTGRARLSLKKNHVFTDLRIIDLYEEATIDHESPETVPLDERKGNWVQKYYSDQDGSTFVSSQFFRYQEVEQFIKENFQDGEPFQKKGGIS